LAALVSGTSAAVAAVAAAGMALSLGGRLAVVGLAGGIRAIVRVRFDLFLVAVVVVVGFVIAASVRPAGAVSVMSFGCFHSSGTSKVLEVGREILCGFKVYQFRSGESRTIRF
jgi:hypothetical protein